MDSEHKHDVHDWVEVFETGLQQVMNDAGVLFRRQDT